MSNKVKRVLLLYLFLLSIFYIHGQETIIVGQVINKADRKALAGVNVRFRGTNTAMSTDTAGYFMLRSNEKVHALVFSSVGYKTVELPIKSGQSMGTQVVMEEENTVIQEVIILPGVNPALEMMKKVRLMRKVNDIAHMPHFSVTSCEQNLVLLTKVKKASVSKRLFNQFKTGSLTHSDSSLIVPLYMSETKNLLSPNSKQVLSKNIFSSPQIAEKLLAQFAFELDAQLNFYDNAVTLFGKSMISPLANIGNVFYDYYLADSIVSIYGKQYELRFKSKNSKNLAFNGKLWIDSTSYALTGVEAELPVEANINYIHQLRISQHFEHLASNRWALNRVIMNVNMSYNLLSDSTRPHPDILVKHSVDYQISDTIRNTSNKLFATSEYTTESINDRLEQFNSTPVMRTARFIGDVLITGFIPVGIIDIGKIQQIIRITDSEGLRITAPFRTNQHLWKKLSIGGYLGYGFLNKTANYSAMAQVRLPGLKRRVIGVNYMNDFRRVDYNYNDFMSRENPLISGDEDFTSSILSGKVGIGLSQRKELTLSFANDWNTDIDSNIFIRFNTLFANANLPMLLNSNPISYLYQHAVTFSTRFSFGQKTYDDHLQRIYTNNFKPVIYTTLELGQFNTGSKMGNYIKFISSIRHSVRMDIGLFNYMIEAGQLFGKLPYPLLFIPAGNETSVYNSFQFSKMNYMEYVADRYVNFHSELILNGLLFNQLPLVKYLNLREMLTCNFLVGGMNAVHQSAMDIPSFVAPLQYPYLEIGAGCTNIFRVFTLQVVRRLTDLNKPGISPWGVRICLSLSF